MKLRSTDFVQIQGWMRSLGLTDKQLLVYAMIWGFSRDGRGLFKGTAPYIAEWLGCTDRNVKKIIRRLEDMGLIAHEVIRTMKKTYTVFWAILPEDAAKTPKRGRIDWRGRELQFPTDGDPQFPTGRELQFPTDKIVISSRDRNIKRSGGGKNSAPGRAKTTTTTTGFLFDNDGSGLAAGEIPSCRLPWEGDALSKAWAMLMKQPAWRRKSPEALAIVCEEIGKYCSYSDAVYLLRLAVKKGWDDIKDPGAIVADDSEHVPQYPDTAWRAVEL